MEPDELTEVLRGAFHVSWQDLLEVFAAAHTTVNRYPFKARTKRRFNLSHVFSTTVNFESSHLGLHVDQVGGGPKVISKEVVGHNLADNGPRVVLRACRRIEAAHRWIVKVGAAMDSEYRSYIRQASPQLEELKIICARGALAKG